MEAPARSLLFFQWKLKIGYAVIFAHKGKSNTPFGTVKGLLLFVCTHNINNAFERRTLQLRWRHACCCCCWTLNTIEPLFTVMVTRSRVVSTGAAIFSSLIDGCLKYKNKEKPKTGPRPGPRLNYEVKNGPKPGPWGVKKSGPGLKCRALSYSSRKTIIKNTEY